MPWKNIFILLISYFLIQSACTIRPIPSAVQMANDTQTSSPNPNLIEYESEVNDGISKGNPIIKALEGYYAKNGHYPEELEDLIPHFLSDIPSTRTGQTYFYNKLDLEGYILVFSLTTRKGEGCGYRPNEKVWECSYGD